MKKSLLIALMATSASFLWAEQKTASFDFSKPADYGYAVPTAGQGTDLDENSKLSNNGADITVLSNGTTKTRFFCNNNGVISLRLTDGCSIGISAGTEKITSITLTGLNINPSTNFTASQTTGWSYDDANKTATWNGEESTLTLTRKSSTIQLATMSITYGKKDEGGNGGGDELVTESYVAIDKNGIAEEFNHPEADEAKSIVRFSTTNMDVEAVGGRTPKDVKLPTTATFEGWTNGWFEPEWKLKRQNLCDQKPGIDTIFFYWVEGTGNPAVAIDYESTSKDDSLVYKAKYTYYEADGSLGMPVTGLYFKFTPKKSGALKIKIWANKGNRKTFLVQESTKKPLPYFCEGYINGQDIKDQEVTMKDMNGNDSIGTMNSKRFLTRDQIDSLHYTNASYIHADTTFVDATLEGPERVAATNIAKVEYTDLEPNIIGAGNQAFFGWLGFNLIAGESYWLFQHSSQVGFGGYEFTPDGYINTDPSSIEQIACKQNPASSQVYDLSGRRVSKMQSGKLYLLNGKKIIKR